MDWKSVRRAFVESPGKDEEFRRVHGELVECS